MKLLVAIIQPDKLDEVRQALVEAEVSRVTVSRVTGHGRATDLELYRGKEFTPDLMPKVRLEIALNDDFVEPTIRAILAAARHGEGALGDGKIFVMPLEECIRIRTGERGGEAIRGRRAVGHSVATFSPGGTMKAVDVIVLGSGNVDVVIRVPSLPSAGDEIRGDESREQAGGKGANVAVGVARLERRAAWVGCIGRDAHGAAVLWRLEWERVDIRSMRSEAPTGRVAMHLDPAGRKQTAYVFGANERLTIEHVRAVTGDLGAARVLVASCTVPLRVVEDTVRRAREAGIAVVLDSGAPITLSDALVSRVDVLRGNALEISAASGIDVRDPRSAAAAGRRLRDRGAGAVVVGSPGGNTLVWGGGEQFVPHLQIPTCDGTGAGDALTASLAVGIVEDVPLDAAHERACAAAAEAASRLGGLASQPRRSEIEERLRELRVR